ncbi:hypothetical protein CJD36_002540 [Flavipsychrobacter stenotrophus]|uniref:Uncharacterized protein n=1 Tax=Flavipsychrobacter stenotrophus TaxID=2077091 RepID=A0A2S7T0B6_9BACT|nr:hypothetical protein [Flavipsychrobacter stenotrophus]PQJ12640.1 hypothetical protein CJD36_002540 [Flavipsychrobacter stenotrophus]
MVSFERIEAIVFGEEGYDKNNIHPKQKEYWADKVEKLSKVINRSEFWEFEVENELLRPFNDVSALSKMLYFVHDAEITNVLYGDRNKFYEGDIKYSCYELLNQISNAVRYNKITSTVEIQKKIRWYIFETNKLAYKYYTPFSFLLNFEPANTLGEETRAANFLLNVYLRDCLINLGRQINLIDSPSNAYYETDKFIILSLEDKRYAGSSYGLFRFHINKALEKGTTSSVQEIYRRLKTLYYTSYPNSEATLLLDNGLLNDICKTENDLCVKVILPQFFELSSVNNFTSIQADLFIKTYSELQNLISSFALPNERMFLLQNIINSIKELLADDRTKDNNLFNESTPRKLLRKLQLDYDTIKANPTIDLKEFDRNSIKPIQTNITVSHLALLFKVLEEHSIIKSDQRNELYKTITKAFTSKSVTGTTISEKSFQNNFNDPDKGSYKYWKEKFLAFSKDFKNYN